MRVDFDLSLLSQGILEEFRQLMAAMQGAIPVLASQVQEWLGDERERRLKAARGQACEPVEMVLPLLCEKELERGLAALTAFTIELERVELEVAAAAATAAKLQTAGTRLFEALPGLFFFSLHHYPPRGVLFSARGRMRRGK
ncbi:MAG: hypothetical protein IH789_12015 [Acidobacteria bacterium]|nr:hypothetical protein [Acidobacteriota bacterium]